MCVCGIKCVHSSHLTYNFTNPNYIASSSKPLYHVITVYFTCYFFSIFTQQLMGVYITDHVIYMFKYLPAGLDEIKILHESLWIFLDLIWELLTNLSCASFTGLVSGILFFLEVLKRKNLLGKELQCTWTCFFHMPITFCFLFPTWLIFHFINPR